MRGDVFPDGARGRNLPRHPGARVPVSSAHMSEIAPRSEVRLLDGEPALGAVRLAIAAARRHGRGSAVRLKRRGEHQDLRYGGRGRRGPRASCRRRRARTAGPRPRTSGGTDADTPRTPNFVVFTAIGQLDCSRAPHVQSRRVRRSGRHAPGQLPAVHAGSSLRRRQR